jgi:ABC-type lipoprotein export system ATPase subunit
VITHNLEVADRFPRRIGIRDGRIERDTTASVRPEVPAASNPPGSTTAEGQQP